MEKIRLSVEELAYLMGMFGGGQQAGAFLKTIIGELEQKELEGRLISAAHSLIARGWLTLEDKQQKQLNPDIQSRLELVLGSDYSIRVSKTTRGSEEIVSYFFKGMDISEHCIEQSVISCLTTISNWEEFSNRIKVFLEISGDVSTSESVALAVISSDLLQSVREKVEAGEKEEAIALLVKNSLEISAASDLVKDMTNTKWRGSVLRMTPQGNLITSEKGFLVLQGEHHLWLFEIISKDQPEINVFQGNGNIFRSLLLQLTR